MKTSVRAAVEVMFQRRASLSHSGSTRALREVTSPVITTLRKLKEDTARDVRDDFYQYGRNNPYATSLGCLKFASAYDLVNRELEPTSAAAKRIPTICGKEFLRGQSNAKKRYLVTARVLPLICSGHQKVYAASVLAVCPGFPIMSDKK